jgi:hypothetical protein
MQQISINGQRKLKSTSASSHHVAVRISQILDRYFAIEVYACKGTLVQSSLILCIYIDIINS